MSFFKPEDFIGMTTQEAIASDHFNKLIEERSVRVYGQKNDPEECGWTMDEEAGHPWATHQALLINIEELPNKECEHRPASEWTTTAGLMNEQIYAARCKSCGIKLKATWEPA